MAESLLQRADKWYPNAVIICALRDGPPGWRQGIPSGNCPDKTLAVQIAVPSPRSGRVAQHILPSGLMLPGLPLGFLLAAQEH